MDFFSPYELFTFAAKLRTNLTQEAIESKVKDLLKELGLRHC